MTTLRDAAQPSDEQIDDIADRFVSSLGGDHWNSGERGIGEHRAIDFARAVLALQPVAKPLTDAYIDSLVRSVQPHLDAKCKAWKKLSEQCRYWLEVERTHKIGGAS